MLSNTLFDEDNLRLTGDGDESHSQPSMIDMEKVREDGLVREADPEIMRQLYGRTDHVLPVAVRGQEGEAEGAVPTGTREGA